MSDQTFCLLVAVAVASIAVLYVSAGSFLFVCPHRHVCVFTAFGQTKRNQTTPPGLYLKWPWTAGHPMFVQEDKDTKEAKCVTIDGITLAFVIDISNILPAAFAEETFDTWGEKYDESNIKENAAYFLQTICSKWTARECIVERFNEMDDKMEALMVHAQLPIYNKDGNLERAASNIRIVPNKTKLYKPQCIGSELCSKIQQEAEHAQEILTAKERKKKDDQEAVNKKSIKAAELLLQQAVNMATLQRKSDTVSADIAVKQAEMEAEVKRQETQHRMDRKKAQTNFDVLIMRANATKQSAFLMAEGELKRLTPAKLQELAIAAYFSANKTVVMGDAIPKSMIFNGFAN